MAVDEEMLNNVHKKKKSKKNLTLLKPKKISSILSTSNIKCMCSMSDITYTLIKNISSYTVDVKKFRRDRVESHICVLRKDIRMQYIYQEMR